MSFAKHPEIKPPKGGVAAKAGRATKSGRATTTVAKTAQTAPKSLSTLQEDAAYCKACPLWEGRTQVVFGGGNPQARVMIVGEAPGKNEDEAGEPFVGAAGKNLTALLERAGLAREDVYIANVLKCRPPSNRNPCSSEIQACGHFLHEQARLVAPEFIVSLGNFATKHIMKTDCGITSMRGRVHEVGKFKVFPVFHPAAALYDRKKQQILEDDFAELGELLNH